MLTHVWYAAYGSNLNRHRFAKYVDIEPEDPTYPVDHWLASTGSVRMAGHFNRWGGGVAFFDPTQGSAIMRRYLLTIDQYMSLWSGENRGEELPAPDSIVERLARASLDEPEVRIPVEGSYDVSWLVGRVDHVPVFTITTGKTIVSAPASASYLDVIAAGLAESPETPTAQASYLASVSARS